MSITKTIVAGISGTLFSGSAMATELIDLTYNPWDSGKPRLPNLLNFPNNNNFNFIDADEHSMSNRFLLNDIVELECVNCPPIEFGGTSLMPTLWSSS